MFKKMTGVVTAGVLLLATVNFSALGDNDQRKAVIKSLKNKVELKYGQSLWREASMNQLIRPGTSVRTGSLSKAELLYPDGSITRIGSRTNIVVLDKSFRAVKVESGRMWFKVTKRSAGLKIYSPTAVAAITGTEGFAQFGKAGDEKETASQGIRLASSNKNSSFKVSEAPGTDNFNFGLAEGSANVFKTDATGEPTGDSLAVLAGQILSFSNGAFNLQNVGIDNILEQNRDINQPDAIVDNSHGNAAINSAAPADEALGPANVATDKVPNNLNNSQEINKSPTTGDLEIIIK